MKLSLLLLIVNTHKALDKVWAFNDFCTDSSKKILKFSVVLQFVFEVFFLLFSVQLKVAHTVVHYHICSTSYITLKIQHF